MTNDPAENSVATLAGNAPKKDAPGSLGLAPGSASEGPWTYSRYRATLKKDGKIFAIVSPGGQNALSDADTETLLRALNSEKKLDTILHDVNYKGGLQDWIARYDALFLEMCVARGVITPSLPNDKLSNSGQITNE